MASCVCILLGPAWAKNATTIRRFSTKFLCQSREENNRKFIKTLKEGSRSGDLLEHCRKDLKAGRMECPRLAHECNLAEITLSTRFGVEQGVLL